MGDLEDITAEELEAKFDRLQLSRCTRANAGGDRTRQIRIALCSCSGGRRGQQRSDPQPTNPERPHTSPHPTTSFHLWTFHLWTFFRYAFDQSLLDLGFGCTAWMRLPPSRCCHSRLPQATSSRRKGRDYSAHLYRPLKGMGYLCVSVPLRPHTNNTESIQILRTEDVHRFPRWTPDNTGTPSRLLKRSYMLRNWTG